MIIRKSPATGIFEGKNNRPLFLLISHIIRIFGIVLKNAGRRGMKDGSDSVATWSGSSIFATNLYFRVFKHSINVGLADIHEHLFFYSDPRSVSVVRAFVEIEYGPYELFHRDRFVRFLVAETHLKISFSAFRFA